MELKNQITLQYTRKLGGGEGWDRGWEPERKGESKCMGYEKRASWKWDFQGGEKQEKQEKVTPCCVVFCKLCRSRKYPILPPRKVFVLHPLPPRNSI